MASDLTRNGRLSGLLRRIGDSWQGLAALVVIATLALAGWGKIKTVAQVPAKLDSLRFSHDTQTAILRRSERWSHEQVRLTMLICLRLSTKENQADCVTASTAPTLIPLAEP